MRRESERAESQRACGTDVASACLANKGTVTGRACSFQGLCFSRVEVFEAGYAHVRSTALFVLRSGPAGHLTWLSGHDCSGHS